MLTPTFFGKSLFGQKSFDVFAATFPSGPSPNLSGSTISPTLDLSGSTFSSTLDLSGSKFSGILDLSGSTIS